MEILTEEADAIEKKRLENREELLRMQVKLSQLTTANGRNKIELEKITLSNETLIKNNIVTDEKNTKLDKEIVNLI
jgi:hypothetical protein